MKTASIIKVSSDFKHPASKIFAYLLTARSRIPIIFLNNADIIRVTPANAIIFKDWPDANQI